MAVCTTWINKYGKQKSDTVADGKHVINIVTNKFTYQNNLQRSLRATLAKKGLGAMCAQASVFSNIIKGPTRQQMEARITQLEDKVNVLEVREPAAITNVNNFILLQNFGSEDMSYLHNPTEYLEKTFAGMRTLLQDIYFNDAQTQNHTVRINMSTKKAEVHTDGAWKTIAMPVAKDKMIGNCRTYLIKGFNSDVHKHNDPVMDFTASLYKAKTTVTLESDIHDGLFERHKQAVEAIVASTVAPMASDLPPVKAAEVLSVPFPYSFESVAGHK